MDMTEKLHGADFPIPDGFELGTATTVCREMDGCAAEVWRLISRSGYLEACHPFCDTNVVERWPGVGARDRILYFSGMELVRDFTHWDDEKGYQLEIGPPGSKSARVVWVLTALGDDRSELAITIIPYVKADMPENRKKAFERLVFGDSIEAYLHSVVKGIEHVVTTGENVLPDQFGRHPAYSASVD
jgi:hypothetical protein